MPLPNRPPTLSKHCKAGPNRGNWLQLDINELSFRRPRGASRITLPNQFIKQRMFGEDNHRAQLPTSAATARSIDTMSSMTA